MSLELSRKFVDGEWRYVAEEEPGGGGNGGSQTQWSSGSANPSDDDGADGDFYLTTTSGYVFEKVSGSWAFKGTCVLPGGTAGQVLAKQDEFEGDLEWIDPPGIQQGGPLTEALDADGNAVTNVGSIANGGGTIAIDAGDGSVTATAAAGGSLALDGSGDAQLIDSEGNSVGLVGDGGIVVSATAGELIMAGATDVQIGTDDGGGFASVIQVEEAALGFFNAAPIAQQTGVPITVDAIHGALVALGLITP